MSMCVKTVKFVNNECQ